ncbi:multidrug efflux RND transporter permease subunit [Oceanicoccus sagamiensis]|uniref:Efflux pump membrane transporter n=1 Tax=Oceanicoccus sagamiensis TaxID=716816 RepID=A0A1X9NGU6_9GAMM|nr:multidrug efflux RND transporter permease subunit [Oceanicoccus sagamiensis]
MPQFFIGRPVFAAVISIVISLVGALSLLSLPIDQYPYISPPTVKVSTSFPGATAITAAESVSTPLEEELNGVPNMLYMRSQSKKDGGVNITITFDVGTDPGLAAVDVQNSAKQADASLPVDVMQEGVSVEQEAAVELLKIGLTATDKKYDDVYLSNFVAINIASAVRRIPGVGRTRNTGARTYSMRIWLRPDRMASYGLTTSDIIAAIKEQNTESAAGTLGAQPGGSDVALTSAISTSGRLQSADEFNNIIVRAHSDGSMIRLRDIGRAELGAKAYRLESKLDGKDTAILQVYLLPGANALEVASKVKETLFTLSETFPRGIETTVWYDSSTFIRSAIYEVLITLIEALILVILVVYLFLQNWRATLIPALAVPVSIIGTFATMAMFGFTINTVNLLALVLAIGIVVDDAIVVVENVERLMAEKALSAVEATREAMKELTGALVATSLVLAAVFVPVSFLAGITGIMYREFALSITVAVLISTVVALTLSPALCALLLKPATDQPHGGWLGTVFGKMNRWLELGAGRYSQAVVALLKQHRRAWLGFFIIMLSTWLLFKYLPASFMPVEDQGRFFVDLELPDGQSVVRSRVIGERARYMIQRHPAVKHVFSLTGESKRSGANDAAVSLEVILEDWDLRQKNNATVDSVMEDVRADLKPLLEVTLRVFKPSAVAGLGSGGGVEMELQDRSGNNFAGLADIADELIYRVSRDPAVASISTDLKEEIPLLKLEVDRAKAKALGVPLADIYSTTKVFTGATSANDFNMFGRVYRVNVQAEAEFRDRPDALNSYYVRANSGAIVPINVLAELSTTTGPAAIVRHNMFTSASISADPAPGYSTGDVIKAIEREAKPLLPPGMGYEWSGLTFQEIRSAGQTTVALSMALIFVFLFLAALYESWTIPVAVLLIAPIAMMGALMAMWLRGLENNLFFQIAFIALIGLAAKNSILIVEFCRQLYNDGMKPFDAAVEAAKLRFRPIMMTAVSFILGVLPLVLSTGPGALARQSMSTAILGGMLLATTLGIIFVPLFFVTVINFSEQLKARFSSSEKPLDSSEVPR